MTVRAGNGKFVSKSNPIAIMASHVDKVTREQREAEQRAMRYRRRSGYRGPLTRADLAATGR